MRSRVICMGRGERMRLNAVAFVLGACLLQALAELPSPLVTWAALPLAAGSAALLPRFSVRSNLQLITAVVLAFAIGFLWAAGRAEHRIAGQLAPSLEGKDLRVVGVVAGLPQAHERGLRFDFDIERAAGADVRLPSKVTLNWYGRAEEDDARPATLPAVRAGERWSLAVRLKRPHGTANPHGFDYELWLLEQDIGATGYVRRDTGNRVLDGLVAQPVYLVQRMREIVRERFRTVLGDRPYAGVLIALAVGDQRAISGAQWQVFTRTGVNHLMSISGLHITMVAGLVAGLAGFVWRRSRWALRFPSLKAAAVAGFAAAFGYALLAGFAVPAQRTVLMLAVVAAALWRGVEVAPSSVLALASLVVVVFDPWAVTSAGFWLSFGAVGLILHITTGRIGHPHWLAQWGRVQWAVTIGLVPLLLALFHQVSIASPLANAVAIPVISLVVVPLALIGAVPPLGFLLPVAHAVLAACMHFLGYLSAAGEAVWESHAPMPWTVALAVAGVLWLLLPRGFPARWLGVLAFVPMFTVRPVPPAPGALRLTVLDVGQGLAVVAQTRHHALLYDAGPDYSGDADAGNRIVVPYLRASGITRLDGVVLSHDDLDHIGGAASVRDALPRAWMATSLPVGHVLGAGETRHMRCFDGQRWEWDGVRFEMLHPLWGEPLQRGRDNDSSCVLRIVTDSGSVLLPGDIERRAEAALTLRSGNGLRATLLIAPHHGSRTSSSDALLDAVQPQTVAFTAGYRNRFGHPKDEVVARYGVRGVDVLRSDRDGALIVDFANGEMRVERWRQVQRRYWQTEFVPL